MTVNQRIIAALKGFGMDVVVGVDTESRARCFTFNYDLLPTQFANNCPIYYRALIQIHLFLSLEENSVAMRRQVAEALAGAGFTWPEIVDASDEDGQHIVFECEVITGRE